MNFDSYTLTKIAKNDKYTTYDLFFGPNHPGMNGNFGYVLDMVGTEINNVRINAGQLHRGFEKLMERRGWVQNLTLVPRICVMDPDPNEVTYCMAVEKIMNVEIPERAKYLRTITLEMSRLTSLLISIGGAGASLGLYTIMHWTMADRDLVLDMFEWLTGGRVYHIYNIPGGVRRDTPKGFLEKLYETMEYLESRLPDYDRLLFENPIIHKRLKGLGPVTKEEARKTGLSGPNLRASGNALDIRKDAPYAAYSELEFDIITQEEGDAFARALQMRLEYEQAIDLIKQAIKKMPEGDVHANLGNLGMLKVQPGEAYAKVESSKGEFGYYIVSKGEKKPYRVSVRGPSLPAGFLWATKHLPKMKIDDVAVWMGTFGICAPDFDK